ncbi:GNAT family N-acetyltransferase [Roseovarius arcticus]|uniref:GNAT family N-acetyltransferase n=1 Tax=Roseovarius arcticus TaxID=2547404 RepID=UPI00111003D0|nr:GNAT family N-acetyltransferase [Roseovarius arcticus]
MIEFRTARREDVAEVVALLADDVLGAAREAGDLAPYLAAFDHMAGEAGNTLIVGTDAAGGVIATYQITFIIGLSLRAARRAQIESVRVAGSMRGQGIGRQMFADAIARARNEGCALVQLTMNAQRADANRFYESLGFVPSHTGFKLALS